MQAISTLLGTRRGRIKLAKLSKTHNWKMLLWQKCSESELWSSLETFVTLDLLPDVLHAEGLHCWNHRNSFFLKQVVAKHIKPWSQIIWFIRCFYVEGLTLFSKWNKFDSKMFCSWKLCDRIQNSTSYGFNSLLVCRPFILSLFSKCWLYLLAIFMPWKNGSYYGFLNDLTI